MKFNWLDIVLILLGPTVLRSVIPDNTEYLVICFFYGVLLGLGRIIFSDLDNK